MSGKHTPGPWTAREVSGAGWPGQRGFAIDFNADQEQVVDFVYEEADAHLIAAAPDLLEALLSARDVIATALKSSAPDWFETDDDVASHHTVKKIDAAISKARGAS